MDTKVALAFALGAAAAAGVALYQVNQAASTLANGSDYRLACDDDNHYKATVVTIDIKSVPGAAPIVTPESCFVVPGQIVLWQFDGIPDLQLRFGKDAVPQPTDATPDENYALAFKTVTASTKEKDLSIQAGPSAGGAICTPYPYRVSADGVQWTPNPSIIIKPKTMTSNCPNEQ